MVIYRVKIRVKNFDVGDTTEKYLSFMKNEHVPLVLKTGYPLEGSGVISRRKAPEPSAPNDNGLFEIDYFFESEEVFQRYRSENGKDLKAHHDGGGWDESQIELERELILPL